MREEVERRTGASGGVGWERHFGEGFAWAVDVLVFSHELEVCFRHLTRKQ